MLIWVILLFWSAEKDSDCSELEESECSCDDQPDPEDSSVNGRLPTIGDNTLVD